MYELNKRYTLISPKGVISPAGIQELHLYIQAQRPQNSDDWKAENSTLNHHWLPALPDSWQWVWVVTTGDLQGTFPRRVARYYFKEHGLKCPESFLTEIGNIARRHSETDESYHFDFNNDFDWEDGEFDDDGSCYWWNGGEALDLLRNNGFHAIRFFRSEESDEGIGRAWIYPMSETMSIVFNGYGYQTRVIARIMALFLKLTYKHIHLANNYDTTGVMYINNGSGYLVGSPDDVFEHESYDFHIHIEGRVTCENCGRSVYEDESFYTPDGYDYCEDCYYRHYARCVECDEIYHQHDLTYVNSVHGDVCEGCLERYFVYCDSCDAYYSTEREVMNEHEGEWLCSNCFSQLPPPDDESEDESD